MVGLGMPDEDRVTVWLRRADRFCGLDIMREIASYLSGVYRELSEGRGYSNLLRLDISTAPASGRAKRLVIGQRDGEGLNANGLVIQYRVADNEGFREDPQAVPHGSWGEDHLIENPMVLFISDGQGVWLAAKFGPNWNRFKLGRLNDVGGRAAGEPSRSSDEVARPNLMLRRRSDCQAIGGVAAPAKNERDPARVPKPSASRARDLRASAGAIVFVPPVPLYATGAGYLPISSAKEVSA
jgi:hypothetical protein